MGERKMRSPPEVLLGSPLVVFFLQREADFPVLSVPYFLTAEAAQKPVPWLQPCSEDWCALTGVAFNRRSPGQGVSVDFTG